MTEPDTQWEPFLQIQGATREIREAIGAVSTGLAFIDQFLLLVFRELTGLETSVAHYITRDMKSNQLQRILRDIAKHQLGEMSVIFTLFSEVLSELSTVREKRNKYIHWILKSTEDTLHLMKPRLEPPERATAPEPISLEEIRETADDIGHILLQMDIFCGPPTQWFDSMKNLLDIYNQAIDDHRS